MGAKVSVNMLQARELLRTTDKSAYRVAKETGLWQSTISEDKVCREIINQRRERAAAIT